MVDSNRQEMLQRPCSCFTIKPSHAPCSDAIDQQRAVFTEVQKHEGPSQPCTCPLSQVPPSLEDPCLAGILTYISQALHGDSKALGAWQQVVLETGQSLGLGHLHADLVFLLCEPCALTVNQELESKGCSHTTPRSTRGHSQPKEVQSPA